MNSYCTSKKKGENTTLNKKLQLYCDFHTHLSKIVFGLKLQMLKLYHEGISVKQQITTETVYEAYQDITFFLMNFQQI